MNEFQTNLKKKMDVYAHFIYKISNKFPKSELYGVTSQLRRAALSVILNYLEGYARRKLLVRLNFTEIAYGSLQESKYLLNFSLKENYILKSEFETSFNLSEEIGAMLWKEIKILEKSKLSNK